LKGTIEQYFGTCYGDGIVCVPFSVAPLHPDDRNPLQRAIEQRGWVEFYIEGSDQSNAEVQPWEECLTLTVTDSLGNKHTIPATRISVARALFRPGQKEDLDI
jgi:hypothetical protein